MNWKFRLIKSTDMRTKVKSYCPIAELEGEIMGCLEGQWGTKSEAQAGLDFMKEQLKGE